MFRSVAIASVIMQDAAGRWISRMLWGIAKISGLLNLYARIRIPCLCTTLNLANFIFPFYGCVFIFADIYASQSILDSGGGTPVPILATRPYFDVCFPV